MTVGTIPITGKPVRADDAGHGVLLVGLDVEEHEVGLGGGVFLRGELAQEDVLGQVHARAAETCSAPA